MKPFCCLLLLHVLLLVTSSEHSDYYSMAPNEAEACYNILEAINAAVPWRALHPDNLCLFGPHGLNCDVDDNNVLHVAEFSLGWVAENDNNPGCGRNATISPSFGKLPYLRKLFFFDCFTEREVEIDPVIWELGASLQHLVFMHNSALVGEIPREMSNLIHLERLVLVDNGLKGVIPAEIGSLKDLNQLVLSGNKLTGHIPEELGRLQRLKMLDLNGNMLSGSIPTSLIKVSKLEKLDLSSNALTGSIPSDIGELSLLQLLDISHNNLSGSIPSSCGKLTQLRIMQLSSNNFLSELPHSIWGNLTLLSGLGLSHAGLQGRIPLSLGHLTVLNYLDLSSNKLDGMVPFTLGHLPQIYQINLSDNALVGLLPFSVDFVTRLGRNLQFKGNEGLCVSSNWLLSSELGDAVEGLQVCDSEYWAASSEQEASLTEQLLTQAGGWHVSQSGILLTTSIGFAFVFAFGNQPL